LQDDTPRGKVCDRCGGVAVLNPNSKAKEIILAKLSNSKGSSAAPNALKKGEK
jgi:hypothetical protein